MVCTWREHKQRTLSDNGWSWRVMFRDASQEIIQTKSPWFPLGSKLSFNHYDVIYDHVRMVRCIRKFITHLLIRRTLRYHSVHVISFSFWFHFINVDKYFPYPQQMINEMVLCGFLRSEMTWECCSIVMRLSTVHIRKYEICDMVSPSAELGHCKTF